MNPSLLRLLDANCNRAREALRVLEDYARFVLDHADLSGRLKAVRHEFQSATASLQARAVAWRQYMQILVGEATLRGIALDGAGSPLVQ